MSPQEAELMEALRAAEEHGAPSTDAAAPDKLWAALHGELEPDQALDVIDDALRSPAGLEEARLAAALEEEFAAAPADAPAAEPTVAEPPARSWVWPAVAVAIAAGVMAMLALRPDPPPEPQPGVEYRGNDGVVEPRVPHGASLPADAFELRWNAVDEGAVFDLTVSTAGGTVLVHRRGLREPAFRVPPDALADMASGDRLLWQVEVQRPDGTRDRSATFVVIVR